MKIKRIAKICAGQDGAIYGGELFRLDAAGGCRVYDMGAILRGECEEPSPIATFRLDRAAEIVPHSNAVCFGSEFYEEGDEYPILYTNIYNNYAKSENKLIGVCLAYRIWREGDKFRTKLLQLIEIGFTEDPELWQATPEGHGVRPYGNFLVDTDKSAFWAFVMRDEEHGTAYFKFDLPGVRDGVTDGALGIKRVVLGKEDVRARFTCEYHRYIQGAALFCGRIYSAEGFSNDTKNRPAIRVVDLNTGAAEYVDIMDMGYVHEPEFVDFFGGECYYSDVAGNLYTVDFLDGLE